MVASPLYPVDHLREFARRVFERVGVPGHEAVQAADILTAADLRGIDSHGVARLRTYFDLLSTGRINARPSPSIVRETPATATLDGDNGMGLAVGPIANDLAMRKAQEAGAGWVAVCNSNHFGIAGYYVMKALERDLVGMAMSNSTPIVTPLWGAQRMLGTNPLAIAFPAADEPPIVIDMATSAVPLGKIEIALRTQAPIPVGWAIDAEGDDTTDPQRMTAGGALLPLGHTHERGGHKGYALTAMVDILSCALSGANWGPWAPPFQLRQEEPARSVGKGLGHFFGAWRIDAFIEADAFKRQIDDWIRTFRSTRPAPGTAGPIIPGDPEREAEQARREAGIPILMPVIEDLRRISQESGVPFD